MQNTHKKQASLKLTSIPTFYRRMKFFFFAIFHPQMKWVQMCSHPGCKNRTRMKSRPFPRKTRTIIIFGRTRPASALCETPLQQFNPSRLLIKILMSLINTRLSLQSCAAHIAAASPTEHQMKP